MVPSAPPRLIAYTCAALVNYTEDLQTLPPSLLSHASPLLQQLHNLLTNPTSRQDVRLKAMSSIAQLASVLAQAKELKHDVYEGVMQSLWVYLDGEVDNEVRARAMDCMSLIGKILKSEGNALG